MIRGLERPVLETKKLPRSCRGASRVLGISAAGSFAASGSTASSFTASSFTAGSFTAHNFTAGSFTAKKILKTFSDDLEPFFFCYLDGTTIQAPPLKKCFETLFRRFETRKKNLVLNDQKKKIVVFHDGLTLRGTFFTF